MGIIDKPFSFSSLIVASELNATFDALFTLVNGNLDDANFKSGAALDGAKILAASIASTKIVDLALNDTHFDWTSVKVLRSGPTIGNSGIKVATGSLAFTYAAGAATVIFSFSNGAHTDHGDPHFIDSAKLSVITQVRFAGAVADRHRTQILSLFASGFSVLVESSDIADVKSGFIDYIAIGEV